MTSQQLAQWLHRIATADDHRTLTELAMQLRREHPSDPEAETVARQVELKRRRIVQES